MVVRRSMGVGWGSDRVTYRPCLSICAVYVRFSTVPQAQPSASLDVSPCRSWHPRSSFSRHTEWRLHRSYPVSGMRGGPRVGGLVPRAITSAEVNAVKLVCRLVTHLVMASTLGVRSHGLGACRGLVESHLLCRLADVWQQGLILWIRPKAARHSSFGHGLPADGYPREAQ